MNFFNFSALILHPNTEASLIEKRDWLLQNEFSNFFPIFPLYGILPDKEFSLELKKKYSELTSCSLKGYFCKNEFLYFYGELLCHDKIVQFIIPFGIEKKTDSKNLLSVYKSSFDNLCKLDTACVNFSFDQITFRSFQIADCHILENNYSVFDNFWVKSK